MLENCIVENQPTVVLRLANALRKPITAALLQIGVDPVNLDSTSSKLANAGMPFTAEEIIDDAFRPSRRKPTPFRVSRFSDGTIGVCYSALDKQTCKKEVAFHIFEKNPPDLPRIYTLISCQYRGKTADLRGCEVSCSDLASETKSGYPFCQQLALQAIEKGFDGLFTASARHKGGTCVPVFSQSALSEPSTMADFSLLKTAEGARFEQL